VSDPVSPAEAIFLALADLSIGDRDAFLRERCGGDAALRAEVDAMLAAIDMADDGFLDPARIPALDMAAVDGPLQPGAVLGDFLVLHAIGSGGMGVVYAAQQDRPRRTVAIKVLRRGFRHPEILKRFEREAELLGRLQHPGIAQVFAFHRGDRRVPAHLVMEFVTGPPITEYVQAHALDYTARVALMMQVCLAVQHAHERGIEHRDLKPANVLVSDDGAPKVLDFGIARATGLDIHSTIQTAHGQLLGTVAYMSPERLRGSTSDVDGRSDVYALGVMVYRLMAGRLPFDIGGLPLADAAQRILHTEVPSLGTIDPILAGSIEHIARRAMAPHPDQRYQSAADMAADLHACLEGRALTASSKGGEPPARVRVAESGDRRLVAIAFTGGAVAVHDSTTGLQLAIVEGDGTSIDRLAFDGDRTLAIEYRGGRVERVAVSPGD